MKYQEQENKWKEEGREQATSNILKFLEKRCVHCLIVEELKQEIQGVKGE